jgi:DNA-directed RNA polymerase specialized sigma24 family protein
MVLSADLQDALMSRIASSPAVQPDRRLGLLAECVKKLSSDALDLLQRCYIDRVQIKDVALQLGRSLAGTYQALFRVRRELLACMQKGLRREDRS